MSPVECEYLVGPKGFLFHRPEDGQVYYEPGALVWLEAAPKGADLSRTGRTRAFRKGGWYRAKAVRNYANKAITNYEDKAG